MFPSTNNGSPHCIPRIAIYIYQKQRVTTENPLANITKNDPRHSPFYREVTRNNIIGQCPYFTALKLKSRPFTLWVNAPNEMKSTPA